MADQRERHLRLVRDDVVDQARDAPLGQEEVDTRVWIEAPQVYGFSEVHAHGHTAKWVSVGDYNYLVRHYNRLTAQYNQSLKALRQGKAKTSTRPSWITRSRPGGSASSRRWGRRRDGHQR